jgi:hypothetical protein
MMRMQLSVFEGRKIVGAIANDVFWLVAKHCFQQLFQYSW